MDKQLLNYKNQDIEYLDGRYFNVIFRNITNVIQQPLVIRASPDGVTVVGGLTLFKIQGTQYMRLIIEFVEPIQNQGQFSPRKTESSVISSSPTQPKVISRHSNLLVIDNIKKRIQRFEPLDSNMYDPFINAKLMKFLESSYSGYTYNELSIHPQKDNKLGLCVAYVIKFVYFHHHEGAVSFEGNYDIYQFGKAIVKLYGILDDRYKDIEFGYPYAYNPYGSVAIGVGLGALGGLTVGGIIGGPGGALAGGLLGAGIGAAPLY